MMPSGSGGGRKRLSKNLLQMKFMKRTKEKEDLELETEESRAIYRDNISDAMRTQGGRFSVEPSYAKVENLVFGRMAFRGMNPDIERMMEAERVRQEEEAAALRETEVNDEAMAAHFGALRATVGRKFATKRQVAADEAGGSGGGASGVSHVDEAKLIRRGEELLAQAKSGQHRVWTKEEGHLHAQAGKSGGVVRRKKFMKPPKD